MGKQWKLEKPKGLEPEKVLIFGPDEFDDKEHVWFHIEDVTKRMEAIDIYLIGDGTHSILIGRKRYPMGVDAFANLWAERNWWPRWYHNWEWWGQNPPRARKARNAELMQRLGSSAHCLAFYDGEDSETEELMEIFREVVPISQFHVRRI